ncbi:uncharacterized protein LOC142775174 [Rhipicephalus microplus]|uniref:uncharacterized protein LOC142775174 n=1 Tax=Rhipicephalus microplus TaxID=6941 RepID=UPI003F6AE668
MVRVVFDPSSHEYSGPSLNDMLDKDTVLGPELLQLLLQFRSTEFVLTADIRNAFVQICIKPEDRGALRFLWIDHLPSSDHPVSTIVEWRMSRVPFGVSSSPCMVSATLQHHLAHFHPSVGTWTPGTCRGVAVCELVLIPPPIYSGHFTLTN